VLLALGLWILACPASGAEENDPDVLYKKWASCSQKENIRKRFP
jgi:hypothetical protein